MATFDASQITDLARIFGKSSNLLSFRVGLSASIITDADKTAVLLDITAYELIEDDNVNVSAGPAGFEGSISPAQKRSLIKKRIAGLLLIEDLLNSGTGLVRG